MIFKSKENRCLTQVLAILNKKNSTYGKMFRETKVSHTTLQRVLKYLLENKFVHKTEKGYAIEDKGINLFNKLEELKTLL